MMADFQFGFKAASNFQEQQESESDGPIALAMQMQGSRAQVDDVFKAYTPNFLYKPPFGYPRNVNLAQIKLLAKSPYVFSVIKTMCDEAVTVPWEIKVKEAYNQEGQNYQKDIDKITRFFQNPNGNEESFEHIERQLITDVLEVDSGVIVKVFNRKGEFSQIFSKDGASFLKNPDIYGYMGNRQPFVLPLPVSYANVRVDFTGKKTDLHSQVLQTYDSLYKETAAYFQYGWGGVSLPIPFGKREIVYISQNPRGDSIYGRSPVEVLTEVLLNLIYGVDFNLDFYLNNNMPEGAIELSGATKQQIKNFRQNFASHFRFTDQFGKERKSFYKVPISSMPIKFTPFQLTSKDMEVLAQQQWFTKIMWMCFGVTADEMGFTESSNKSVGEVQTKLAKRKALKPLLRLLAYHINTQILPEFYAKDGIRSDMPDFSDIPIEFCYDEYDVEEDLQKLSILEKEITLGMKTAEMGAVERGIDVNELKKQKAENMKQQQEIMAGQSQGTPGPNDPKQPNETKKDELPKEDKEPKDDKKDDAEKKSMLKHPHSAVSDPLEEIDMFLDGVKEKITKLMGQVPEHEVQ